MSPKSDVVITSPPVVPVIWKLSLPAANAVSVAALVAVAIAVNVKLDASNVVPTIVTVIANVTAPSVLIFNAVPEIASSRVTAVCVTINCSTAASVTKLSLAAAMFVKS